MRSSFSSSSASHDISGWAKAIWVIVVIVFSYLAIFIYLITQHRGMAQRQSQRVEQAREDLRHFVGFSVSGPSSLQGVGTYVSRKTS